MDVRWQETCGNPEPQPHFYFRIPGRSLLFIVKSRRQNYTVPHVQPTCRGKLLLLVFLEHSASQEIAKGIIQTDS
jgi:hypothetical protein